MKHLTTQKCSQGQIKGHYYRKVFPSINLTFTGKLEDSEVTEEDVLTGFKTFSAIPECPSLHSKPKNNYQSNSQHHTV